MWVFNFAYWEKNNENNKFISLISRVTLNLVNCCPGENRKWIRTMVQYLCTCKKKMEEAANAYFKWKFKVYCLCTIHHPIFNLHAVTIPAANMGTQLFSSTILGSCFFCCCCFFSLFSHFASFYAHRLCREWKEKSGRFSKGREHNGKAFETSSNIPLLDYTWVFLIT